MAVDLSIKNVPDDLARRLRVQAKRNHRSVRAELLAILEGALYGGDRLGPKAVLREVRRLKLQTRSEATRTIRGDRDER